MKLNSTIKIQPPKFTNNEGVIVTPDPIIISDLNISYIDNPYNKIVNEIGRAHV